MDFRKYFNYGFLKKFMQLSKRVLVAEVQAKKESEQVLIAGWVKDIKVLGKIAFISLRDCSGELQLVSTRRTIISQLKELTRESVIAVAGKVKKSKLKAGGNELEIDQLRVLSKAAPKLPIDISGKIPTDLSKRLDWRVLDLRNPKHAAIFRVRAKICQAIRQFLDGRGFMEMQTPKLVGAGAEGGATLFVLDYYGKPAYLSQSQQLYKQLMNIAGFEAVYEIGPSFRAEKSHTTRHLSEFTHLDVEFSFIDSEEDVFKIQEELLVHILKVVREQCKAELQLLGVEIKLPKIPFPRIPYDKAIKFLQDRGVKIKHGQDIGTEEEKVLGKIIKEKFGSDVYFLTRFPWSLDVCKFYWMKGDGYGCGGDLEYKGTEISTGSQREHRYEILVKQIKEKGLNPEHFKYYTEPFKYGAPPHGGFGLGVDRLTQLILNLPNIREAVLFPRDPERLMP